MYIVFPSEDYVKNLIATFPYVRATISGRYHTVGASDNYFSVSVHNSDARNENGTLKDGWRIVDFRVGAGAQESTFNTTGDKYRSVSFLTRGNDNNPTRYGTTIIIQVQVRENRGGANGTLNTMVINFLKS